MASHSVASLPEPMTISLSTPGADDLTHVGDELAT